MARNHESELLLSFSHSHTVQWWNDRLPVVCVSGCCHQSAKASMEGAEEGGSQGGLTVRSWLKVVRGDPWGGHSRTLLPSITCKSH